MLALVPTLWFALYVAYLLLRGLEVVPYDDGYFFKRFAVNFSEHGTLSWNPGEGPVHGLTSQLYSVVAVGLYRLAPAHFVLASKVLAALCLIAAVWRLTPLLTRRVGKLGGFALSWLTFGNPLVTATIHTGMETAFTLLVLSLCLSSFVEHAEAPRPHEPLRAAAWCTLVYLCRPDAALIPVVTFAVLRSGKRAQLFEFALGLAGFLGAFSLLFERYYGTALPLPFYAKALGQNPYDTELRRLGAADKRLHLLTWLAMAAPLLAAWRPRQNRAALALGVAGLGFVAYHAAFTNEIMGYQARFYVPALVPCGLAAAHGAGALGRIAPSRKALVLGAGAVLVVAGYFTDFLPNRTSPPLERLSGSAYLAQLEPILKLMWPAETRSSHTRIGAARGSARRAAPSVRAGHGSDCAKSSCARRPSAAACHLLCRRVAARRAAGCAGGFRGDESPELRAGSRSPCRGIGAQGAAVREGHA